VVNDGGIKRAKASVITSSRLLLCPLQVSDADNMVSVLAQPDLYRFTGGEPPDLATLTARYAMQVEGSLDEDEEWMNWIIRLRDAGEAIGFLQATVDIGLKVPEAELAWLISPEFQQRGFAKEAAQALASWLAVHRTSVLYAKIHPEHVASQLVARSLGLRPTGEFDEIHEELWTNSPPG